MHEHPSAASRLFPLALFAAMMAAAVGAVPGQAIQAKAEPEAPNPGLARVEVAGALDAIPFPIHAHLKDGAGRDYVLVVSTRTALELARVQYRILDPAASPSGYLIAIPRRTGARQLAAQRMVILSDDGRQVIVQNAPRRAEELAALGFDVAVMSQAPLTLQPRSTVRLAPAITYDPRVAEMIGQVQQSAVYDYNGDVSGENPVVVGGQPNIYITTRHTNSGTPVQYATQWALEHMQALGLTASYHTWSSGGYTNRNVIAMKTGTMRPNEIVLVTAHLDDMPSGAIAPGADDNGSGSVGVLVAADILSHYHFERTIRFVLFTGEEQGLLGSARYAEQIAAAGDDVVAVYNMDMISWDAVAGPTLRIHTRTTSDPGYPGDLAIASTFTSVVSLYGLSGSLTPILDADGITASDHASFWNRGYHGVLAIEDDINDFNTNYHTVDDTRDTLNMTYFTNYVRASVGAVAHLALPSDAPCQSSLIPAALAVDTHQTADTSSDGNGVFEPGETVMAAPSWTMPPACSTAGMTGAASGFTGPAVYSYANPDATAAYGAMASLETSNCFDKTGNCFVFQTSLTARVRNLPHIDASFTEALASGAQKTWQLHIGDSFTDVERVNWAYPFVETILHTGVTTGCSPSQRLYCPGATVLRDQMAVFIARAMAGGDANVPTSGLVPDKGNYDCSSGGTSLFADIAPTSWACRHVHYLYAANVTTGCNPAAGLYCSSDPVTRGSMAVFIARAVAGGETNVPLSYTDPTTSRSYSCDSSSPSTHFTDILTSDWYCKHVHYLWATAVVDGCDPSRSLYCPAPSVLRTEMAKFLTNGFHLSLYGP